MCQLCIRNGSFQGFFSESKLPGRVVPDLAPCNGCDSVYNNLKKATTVKITTVSKNFTSKLLSLLFSADDLVSERWTHENQV